MLFKFVLLFVGCCVVTDLVNGHGMVLKPVARTSRWRFDQTAPENYEDNQQYCGGFGIQWNVNDGKCGLCGDNWADATPRSSELGGRYGEGVIVEEYKKNGQMAVGVKITANHKGYFFFNLCNLDANSETEKCFEEYPLKVAATGEEKYYLDSKDPGWYNMTLLLPANLECKHCVFQWTYNTGNSYGQCEDGSWAVGCGAQEWFRTCSDVRVLA